jgi:hypothetical protein
MSEMNHHFPVIIAGQKPVMALIRRRRRVFIRSRCNSAFWTGGCTQGRIIDLSSEIYPYLLSLPIACWAFGTHHNSTRAGCTRATSLGRVLLSPYPSCLKVEANPLPNLGFEPFTTSLVMVADHASMYSLHRSPVEPRRACFCSTQAGLGSCSAQLSPSGPLGCSYFG